MYATVKHGVVRIESSDGHGSGSVIRDDGWIITNAHVVGDDANVTIRFFDGRRFTGRVAARDKGEDLALVRLAESANGLTTIPIVPASHVREGQEVYVIGHPMGLDWSLTRGIVSRVRDASDRSAPNMIQFDAAVSPGNSGGPLLTADGEMVGVVSSKVVAQGAESLAFARRGERVLLFVQRILSSAPTKRK